MNRSPVFFLAGALALCAPAVLLAQGAGPVKPEAEMSVSPAGGRGQVLETMDSGGYTYVQVNLEGTSVWAAAPQFKVKKGDTVVIPPGMPMAKFHSKTLNRTFETIYFVSSVNVVEPQSK
jgi:hypothetical protein